MICPILSEMKKAIKLASAAPIDAPRLCPIDGSAGRYMSMANGPMAEIRPRTTAVLKKLVFMGCWSKAVATDQ